jgi:hypothetical protein
MPVTVRHAAVADMTRALTFYSVRRIGVVRITSLGEFTVAGATIALHSGGNGADTRTGLGFEVDDLDVASSEQATPAEKVTSPPPA